MNREAGTALLLNAAHPPAILIPAGDGKPRTIEHTSDVLGCFKDATFSRVELQVDPGDRIFIFSDGLVERRGGTGEGIAQLFESVCRRKKLSLNEVVREAFEECLGKSELQDDALLMGIEI